MPRKSGKVKSPRAPMRERSVGAPRSNGEGRSRGPPSRRTTSPPPAMTGAGSAASAPPGVGHVGAGEDRDDRGGMALTVDSGVLDLERRGGVLTAEPITADGVRGQCGNLARRLHVVPLSECICEDFGTRGPPVDPPSSGTLPLVPNNQPACGGLARSVVLSLRGLTS